MRLPPGLLAPRHGGGSIADLPATILQTLGVPAEGAGVDRALLPPDALRDVERVVLLVLDGLGARQLTRLREAVPNLAALRGAELTSVAPSTTSAALASLATGLSPLTHGILGYRMHLPDFGLTANMIRMRGVLGGSLEQAGVDLATFFPFPTLFDRLRAGGVHAEAVTRAAFLDGALTRMIYRGTDPHGFVHLPDLFVAGRRRLAGMAGDRGFLRLYYDGVDAVAHRFGPESEEHEAEAASIDAALRRDFLSRVEDPQALLLVTADHGHITVPAERTIRFAEHPDFLAHLAFPPTGEGRFAYLHVRPGHEEAARQYVGGKWSGQAAAVTVENAVRSGLFGPGPEHPEFRRRAGDLLLIATGNHRFVAEYGIHRPSGHIGNHGGLSPEEMLVPLLWARLG